MQVTKVPKVYIALKTNHFLFSIANPVQFSACGLTFSSPQVTSLLSSIYVSLKVNLTWSLFFVYARSCSELLGAARSCSELLGAARGLRVAGWSVRAGSKSKQFSIDSLIQIEHFSSPASPEPI